MSVRAGGKSLEAEVPIGTSHVPALALLEQNGELSSVDQALVWFSLPAGPLCDAVGSPGLGVPWSKSTTTGYVSLSLEYPSPYLSLTNEVMVEIK